MLCPYTPVLFLLFKILVSFTLLQVKCKQFCQNQLIVVRPIFKAYFQMHFHYRTLLVQHIEIQHLNLRMVEDIE